jgi:mRNA interferase HicA
MSYPQISMNGNELIKRLKQLGYSPVFESKRGKGSHGTLTIGNKKTILKDRRKEIGPGLLNQILKDLGLSKTDIM